MAQDISYLGKLPDDRAVISVSVNGNMGPHGGVLTKFLLPARSEVLMVISGPALALFRAGIKLQSQGFLPHISSAENDHLIGLMPKIEDYDWNLQYEQGRVVAMVKVFGAAEGVGLEFVMQTSEPRQYWLPVKVARFFFEYVAEYKAQYEHHKDGDDMVIY